ncbi:MAG: DUF169 domain-containing protein [Desulfobacter sp.]|nr:DUF169 domain-containing protein [Desulfobacter sp.]WDP84676.1 MAG: DUF169 domain-containing protein [Desulfobacter sp.]
MDKKQLAALPGFLDCLGLDEPPMGIFFSKEQPEQGYCPDPLDLPTREKEKNNAINWQKIFSNFSCVLGKIWLARKKQTAAFFSARHFGCPGGAFWLGFNKPQTQTIIDYVSTGVPGQMEGELYCDSPETLAHIFNQVDPVPAPEPYCVFKPVTLFNENETPVLVSFFIRPEALCGLHQLACYVTHDPEVVASPWSAACGSLVAWPMHYLQKGEHRAVVGGWDPSARKFFKTDELSFTLPYEMFLTMLEQYSQSFLKTKTWANVQKKIHKSKKAWNEIK